MTSAHKPALVHDEELKQCCARLYESDIARLLLGDSFHPGGLKLTERLGRLLRIKAGSHVLDIASGRGASALFLAERFGCEVIGLDYSKQNVEQSSREAVHKGLDTRVHFQQADAESLPFPDASFDALVCECAFCTFPEKARAAREFARVLRASGRVGISDLTRAHFLPKELDGLLAWVACIGDAQPIEDYVGFFVLSGLSPEATERHDDALLDMVRRVERNLLGLEIMAGLKKLDFPGLDLPAAKGMANATRRAVRKGQLGYAIVTAKKDQGHPPDW
jgi:ubiquinone/menaquinone biosynthesis C-methylase UbiE